MKYYIMLLYSALLITVNGPIIGQEDDQSFVLESITSMSDNFMTEVKAFNKKMFQAKDDDERLQIEKAKPDPSEMFEKLISIIKEDPTDPVIVPAAAKSVLMFNRMRKQAVDLPYIYDTLDKHHINSPDIALPVMISIYQRGNAAAEKFIKTAYEKSKNDLVKGVAAFGMAQKPGISEDQQIAYLESSLGSVKDYEEFTLPNGRNLKGLVEQRLHSLKAVPIGKLAPEIKGEDIDGVHFKLSDYRGKVVLIDFWGHW